LLEKVFDETYNVREVLDDVIERITLREKLIQTAKQFTDKKKEERFTLATRQFENLMADFLRLYQPIIERIKGYRENCLKDVQGLRTTLSTLNGMLEVSRGIESLAPKAQRMESDAQELDAQIKEKTKTLEKIDDLMNRVRPYLSGGAGTGSRENYSEILGGLPKELYGDTSEAGKETTRKAAGRN
jgi:DNA repair exonuclease SbcCD ATPase subunit